MNKLREVQDRLLGEQFEQWVGQVCGEQPAHPAAIQELNVRLLATLAMLLTQHQVNRRGRCRFCSAGWQWRFGVSHPAARCAEQAALRLDSRH